MKKITLCIVVICLLASSATLSQPARADTHTVTARSGGAQCSDSGSFDPAKITISAGDTIKFVVPSNDPFAAGLEIHNFPGGNFTVKPGESHTTPALLVSVPNYYSTGQSGCQKGTGEVIIQPSTTPITTPNPVPPPPPPPVLLTAPPPKISPTPLAPKVESVEVDGEKVDISKPLSVEYSKTITLSGYTVANGVVNITIHSIVRNEVARANDSGYWTLSISDLEAGNHVIGGTVTNLATKQTSEKVTLLKFSITGRPKVDGALSGGTQTPGSTDRNTPLIAITAGILVLCAAFFATAIGLKNKAKKPHDHIIPPTPPIEVNPTSPSVNTAPQVEST